MVEMMVVLAVIILAAGIALPSISALLSAGADKQAYNLISAQIRAARSLAIREGEYTAVHIQMADPDDLEGKCYSAVLIFETFSGSAPAYDAAEFELATGYLPQAVPGNIAFGDVDEALSGSSFNVDGASSFTAMTLVFSPNGKLVHSVQGVPVRIKSNSPLVTDSAASGPALWSNNRDGSSPNEYGRSTICLFNYKDFQAAGDKDAYLEKNAIILPINVHTGQLYPLD
jgi:Tfp pilus assembly protein FimT